MQSKVGLSFIEVTTSSLLDFSASREWKAASVTMRFAVPSRFRSTFIGAACAAGTLTFERAAAGAEAVSSETLSQMFEDDADVVDVAMAAVRSGAAKNFAATSVTGFTVLASVFSWVATPEAFLRR